MHLLERPKHKTLTTPNAGEDVKRQELNSLLAEAQDGAATLEDSFSISYKMNILWRTIQQFGLLDIYPSELKAHPYTKTCTQALTAASFIITESGSNQDVLQ